MFQTDRRDCPISLENSEKIFRIFSDFVDWLINSTCRPLFFVPSVRGGYYTTLSYHIIHEVFVVFIFAKAKVEVIWFDGLVSGQSLALLHVL